MTVKMTFSHPVWPAALALCACQYVADLRESDVSVRDDGADTADLDADAGDRDTEADIPWDREDVGDPAQDRDAADQDPADPDTPDDPDLPLDDGSESGCTSSTQCDDLLVCNGTETCNLSTGTCLPGSDRPAGTYCDDANPCTADSQCNGIGACIGSGDPCNDGLPCTSDSCTIVNPTSHNCTNSLMFGYCRIEGACLDEGDPDPSNDCRYCNTSSDVFAWTVRTDMSSCSGGSCCDGICHVGADCCADGDCPTGCSGVPTLCSDFTAEDTCRRQDGCSWTGSACTGSPMICESFSSRELCLDQQGCDFYDGTCSDNTCT